MVVVYPSVVSSGIKAHIGKAQNISRFIESCSSKSQIAEIWTVVEKSTSNIIIVFEHLIHEGKEDFLWQYIKGFANNTRILNEFLLIALCHKKMILVEHLVEKGADVNAYEGIYLDTLIEDADSDAAHELVLNCNANPNAIGDVAQKSKQYREIFSSLQLIYGTMKDYCKKNLAVLHSRNISV